MTNNRKNLNKIPGLDDSKKITSGRFLSSLTHKNLMIHYTIWKYFCQYFFNIIGQGAIYEDLNKNLKLKCKFNLKTQGKAF